MVRHSGENLQAQIQFPLSKEAPEVVYEFRKDTYIYFEHGGGILTKPIEAEKIAGKKVADYQAYRSLSQVHLYTGKHRWQRLVGTIFGARGDKAHKKVLNFSKIK